MATLKKKGDPVANAPAAKKKLVPATPELNAPQAKKRKRLAKAFPRPLDKALRSVTLVRDKYTLSEDEYAQLLDMKERLAAQGVPVKKGELLRAGLLLLAGLEEGDLKTLLATLPPLA